MRVIESFGLSDDESQTLLEVMRRFELWQRRDFAWNLETRDGEAWMIEGRRGGAYHPVFRINAEDREVRDLAFAFWKLAGIKTRLNEG